MLMNNKMIGTLAMICAGMLSACGGSESAPTGPDGQPGGAESLVSVLTAPKEGLSVNLDA